MASADQREADLRVRVVAPGTPEPDRRLDDEHRDDRRRDPGGQGQEAADPRSSSEPKAEHAAARPEARHQADGGRRPARRTRSSDRRRPGSAGATRPGSTGGRSRRPPTVRPARRRAPCRPSRDRTAGAAATVSEPRAMLIAMATGMRLSVAVAKSRDRRRDDRRAGPPGRRTPTRYTAWTGGDAAVVSPSAQIVSQLRSIQSSCPSRPAWASRRP